MDYGIFTDISNPPGAPDLKKALGKTFTWWNKIRDYVIENHSEAGEEWNYSKSFGWSARVRDKKRVIVYMLPLDGFFKASFVFGEKAAGEAIISNISKDIKDLISSAKVYAEGRGFRIEVKDRKIVKDIKKLIDIKLLH
jgi:hypothetical protein